jgi:hypothetical protein
MISISTGWRLGLAGFKLHAFEVNSDAPLLENLSTPPWWDVDRGALNEETHADFIIRRVMERGRREEAYLVWDHYGPERIKSALTSAPSLSARTLNFFAHQFHLPHSAFRAHHRSTLTWSS